MIVVFSFSISDKNSRERFLKESFLLADVMLDIVFKILFLIMSNANVDFQAWDLQWRSYTTGNILPTTKWVELIKKKEFVSVALDLEHKAFVVHIATLSVDSRDEVHLSRKT